MSVRLDSILHCFQGVVPATIATCSRDGIPNVTYLSQVYYLDPSHVALSCQFFNKTRRNIEENPQVCVQLLDPLSLQTYLMRLRFDHAETHGPLFDSMALRIDAIASHTGMKGIFRLLSADVFEVCSIEKQEGFLLPEPPVLDPAVDRAADQGPMTEIRGLQLISERINRARDLDELLTGTLTALEALFSFEHSMVLLTGESRDRLITISSHGYGDNGVGAEVVIGEGLIGTAAQQRKQLRISGVAGELRYGRAIREQVEAMGGGGLRPEIPLPGLKDAASQLVIPLVVRDELIGALAVESQDPMRFADWHEAFLNIIGNQIAIGIKQMIERDLDDLTAATPDAPEVGSPPGPTAPPIRSPRTRQFIFYRHDDCVFVDGEYLIRNIPGRILWRLLSEHVQQQRTEFSNRELRLDQSLGLPEIKDNLESRLILLRKRLEQKCPDVRIVPTRRGRFALEVKSAIRLEERV